MIMKLLPVSLNQRLVFVCLILHLLSSCHTQLTSQDNQQKPRSWEIAFEQPFEDAHPFSEGLALIGTGGKYGYIDKTGRVVIKPQFDHGEDFSDGMACVKIGGKHGYINHDGVMIVKPQYEYAYKFSE